jgi:hypothetical protein
VRRDEAEFRSLTPYEERPPAGSVPLVATVHELRPRGVGEVLDLALDVFRSRFGVLVGTATLLWVPVRLAQPLLGAPNWVRPGTTDIPLAALAGVFFTLLATLVVSVLVNAFAALHVAAELEGRPLSARDALRGILSRSVAVLAIAMLGGLATGVATVCLCIPGIFLFWKFYLAPAVCVVEGAAVRQSVSRSFDLCRGRFLPWVGLILISFAITFPLTSMSSIADDPNLRDRALQTLGVSSAVFDWFAVAFTSVFTGVASAFHGVVVTVWYFDCRARRDGVDLSARLERLQAT